MKKRTTTDLLPDHRGTAFPAAVGRFFFGLGPIWLGALLLTPGFWPASAAAQTGNPPPVHSFGLEQPAGTADGDSDELILMDFYEELADGLEAGPSSAPPLPPNVAPAVSAPPAASASPAETAPPASAAAPTVSAPADGGPAVKLPPAVTPAEDRSLSAPLQPPAAAKPLETPPLPAPAEAAPPVQVPAGYTPLPTVPVQAAPASTPEPFTLAPSPESEPAAAQTGADSEDQRAVPLGQTRLPAPQWANTDADTTPSQSQYISGSPLPQFDSSQSNWIQLEIGQGDGSGQAPAATPRPTSVYSLPDPLARPVEQPQKAAPSETKVEATIDQVISQPPAASGRTLESSDLEKLRNVFSDMLPPEPLGARAPTVKQPAAGGPAPSSAAPSGPGQPTRAEDEDTGSSAILKAGGLLSLEEPVGAAEILPPLSGRPYRPEAKTPAPSSPPASVPPPKPISIKLDEPATAAKPEPTRPNPLKPAPPKTEPVKTEAAKPAAKAAAKPASSKASGSAKAQPKKGGGSEPAPANLGLMIINETGRERVGQQYRSVLAQMGYKVISVGDGRPGQGPAGQTVISYRPGLKAQAQAVARHLPGRKVLAEARKGQVLASEIMIFIR